MLDALVFDYAVSLMGQTLRAKQRGDHTASIDAINDF